MCTPNDINRGWICLYRKMESWEWYGNPNMMAVFIHLLIHANYKDGQYRGVSLERGQYLTTEDEILRMIKITRSQLRTCFKKLEKSGEIKRKSNRHQTIITICNFNDYQDVERKYSQPIANQSPTDTQPITDQEPTNDQQIASIKQDNNITKETKEQSKQENKEDKLNISELKAEFEDFRKRYPGTKRGLDTEFQNFRKKHKDWATVIPLLAGALEIYLQRLKTNEWLKPKNLQTWINQRCWEESETPQNNGQQNRTNQNNGVPMPGLGITFADGTTIR